MKGVLLRIIAGSAAVLVISLIFSRDPGALWKVELSCLARHGKSAETPPCITVNYPERFAIIKDRKGSDHYLLLPTDRVSGIEDPLLLKKSRNNYFSIAWDSRSLLSRQGYRPPDTDVLLAVNSRYGRSQDQLHIHISCIDPVVRQKLDMIEPLAVDGWVSIKGGFNGHAYWLRRATLKEFAEVGPFLMVVSGLPQATADMGELSIAVTAARNGGMLLLVTKRSIAALNFASAEELQDQECSEAR